MVKKFLVFSIVLILLLGTGFVLTSASDDLVVKEKVNQLVGGNVGADVSGFVGDFVKKRGVSVDSIKNISQIDFNSLPREVNIQNVGDNNLAIYQVAYDNGSGQDSNLYVVAYSLEKIKSQGDLIVAQDKRNFLVFGSSGLMSNSGPLETASGVETSLNKGYVMPRDGSITAISTNLDVETAGNGSIEIIVYKNGEPINFGNTLDAQTAGVKNDYDVQSKDIVSFEAGDVISVYAENREADSSWKDITTMVEITTVD